MQMANVMVSTAAQWTTMEATRCRSRSRVQLRQDRVDLHAHGSRGCRRRQHFRRLIELNEGLAEVTEVAMPITRCASCSPCWIACDLEPDSRRRDPSRRSRPPVSAAVQRDLDQC
jgi:hypothetical protein